MVSGKTKEFLFSPSDSAGDIAQTVFEQWPEGNCQLWNSFITGFCIHFWSATNYRQQFVLAIAKMLIDAWRFRNCKETQPPTKTIESNRSIQCSSFSLSLSPNFFSNAFPTSSDWVAEAVPKAEVLRLIYQGRFLHCNVTLGALSLPLGKTTVMHLVPRDNLPEPNSQGKQQTNTHTRTTR